MSGDSNSLSVAPRWVCAPATAWSVLGTSLDAFTVMAACPSIIGALSPAPAASVFPHAAAVHAEFAAGCQNGSVGVAGAASGPASPISPAGGAVHDVASGAPAAALYAA